MRKIVIALLCLGTAALVTLVMIDRTVKHRDRPALKQNYISLSGSNPLDLPELQSSDSEPFGAARMRGHWSLLFFGFSTCSLVCPRTLNLLSTVAREPSSGIPSGEVRPLFISIDPTRDTPQQLTTYLAHFDKNIIGLTGTSQAIARFSSTIGAGYRRTDRSFDHSTSIFVLDPDLRLVGILPHPATASQIVADLNELRAEHALQTSQVR